MDAPDAVDYSQPLDLFSQQAKNRSRSRLVIVGFVLFFAWLGFGGDWIAWESTRYAEPGHYRHLFPWFGIVLSTLAGGIALYAWRTGPQKVLWSTGAREITTPGTPDEQQLVNVVDEMAIASGIPRPRVWIVPDDDPNAFATGRDETAAHIAVTEGLLGRLNREELQAVVGHEMGHIKNLDVRLMTLLAALVGAVALIGDGMWRVMRGGGRLALATGGGGWSAGGRGGRGRGGDRKGVNPLIIAALVLWVISWLLAPLITRLLAMSVSRDREYLADAMSAQFTRNPLALASALRKIDDAEAPTKTIKSGSAHLCIADPTGRRSATGRGGWLTSVFATHPPMQLRLARLKAMGYRAVGG